MSAPRARPRRGRPDPAPVRLRELPPGWGRKGLLALLLVAVVLVLGATGFSLAGGEKETRGFATVSTGTAQVLSCTDAGFWFLLRQQECTAEVTLDDGAARTVVVQRGQLGRGDVGTAVPVALIQPETASGRLRYLDDGTVLVRNADRPLRAWSDVVITLTVLLVAVIPVSATRRMESARNPRSTPIDRLATRSELRSVPRGAVSPRVVALWWVARVGLVGSLLVGVARRPVVLVAGTRSDGVRWPGLEAALALPFYLPVLGCFVLWGAASYRRARQRSEAVWVRDGAAAPPPAGPGPLPRWWPYLTSGFLALAALGLAVVALRAPTGDQPWWATALGGSQATLALALAVAVLLPGRPASRDRTRRAEPRP